jgi:signal transduction histidine kinase/ligand-binding sensor domain-containing protein
MIKIKGFQLVCIIFLLTVLMASAQDAGRPFIRNYLAHDYGARMQNWAITQDSRGIMYFANTDGLLEYDGINWRLFKLPTVRSIAIDSLGRIYLGLENDMGYLVPDKDGNYQYYSLKEKIPENHRELTPVWDTYISGDRVIFLSDEKVYIFKNDQIKVLSSESGFRRIYKIRNRIYVRETGKGLSYLENDSLRFIEGSDLFGTEKISAMLPFRQNEILIVTDLFGVIDYSPGGTVKFNKLAGFEEVNNFLHKNRVFSGTVLGSGNIALGAMTGGIIVFDTYGKIINRYTKSKGLNDNTIWGLFYSRDQQLWAAMENGISRIPVNLPFRIYTDQDGLISYTNCLAFFHNCLYVGTSQNLYVRNRQGYFEPIAGTEGQNSHLFESDGTLLLADLSGVFEIKGNQAVPVNNIPTPNGYANTFCRLKNHPGNILAGFAYIGLYLMEYKDGSWKLKHHIKGFDDSGSALVEDTDGNVWNTNEMDLYKLQINTSLDSVILCKRYTSEQGLPSNFAFPYALNSGEVVFGTERGVYRYLADKDRFEPHPDFSMLTGKILQFCQLKDGGIWFEELNENGIFEKGVLTEKDGRYVQYETPFFKFFNIRWFENIFTIAAAPDSTIFFGTSSGLVQYDPSQELNIDLPFNTLIRKIFSSGTQLYGGADINHMNPGAIKGGDMPFKSNDLIFDFASTFYEDPEKTVYSYRLTGSDTTWSAWEKDHKKEYTNLREGSYIFEVRSKNQYQAIGSTASYSFRILPPWYRTWWAYVGYLIFAGLFFYVLVYFRTRKLRERSLELEKTVEQRTAQVQEQKNNVEQLSRIGRDIISSLSIENIIHTIYENVNNLMDASVFTIGLHKPEESTLEFPATIEKNQLLPPFSIPISDENRLAAWCFTNRQEVIINDYAKDYSKYVKKMTAPITGESPESILYLPMWNKDKVIGVITAQSFSKNAYSDYHLNMLRNLATYSAIALENADAYQQLAAMLADLTSAQERLVTQSKLAALGELTAGIAHEIQNPLNFVNNFSEVNRELIEELKHEIDSGKLEEVKTIANNIADNEEKILFHGKRADSIVKGMLQHSRSRSGVKEPTDINVLADEFLRLSYHGLRAKDKSFNATLKTDFDDAIGKINVAPQDIGRVILNLLNNAFYAVTEKKNLGIEGYEPVVTISTKKLGDKVKINVSDNGNGIPAQLMDKIFQPFFTTKPAGQGTGLGLSLSYDIITKEHDGALTVQTKQGEGSTFTIQLPV